MIDGCERLGMSGRGEERELVGAVSRADGVLREQMSST